MADFPSDEAVQRFRLSPFVKLDPERALRRAFAVDVPEIEKRAADAERRRIVEALRASPGLALAWSDTADFIERMGEEDDRG